MPYTSTFWAQWTINSRDFAFRLKFGSLPVEAEKFLIHYAFTNLVLTWRVFLHFSLALPHHHLSAYSVRSGACRRTVIHLAKQFKLWSLRALQRPILRVALLSLAQCSCCFCATWFWDSLAPIAALYCSRRNWCICWHWLCTSALSWLACPLQLELEVWTKWEYDARRWLYGGRVLERRGCSHFPGYAGEHRLVDNLLQEYVRVRGCCKGIFQAVGSLRRGFGLLHVPCYLHQSPRRQIFGALELG